MFPWLVLAQWITEMKILVISGPSTALPRCALPKYFTEELQKHIPNAIFSSNPCRLIFFSYWLLKHFVWTACSGHTLNGWTCYNIWCSYLSYQPILVLKCRVKFYTQEIVFFRQDLLYRMRRSCLIPPSTEETNDPFEHVHPPSLSFGSLCPPAPSPSCSFSVLVSLFLLTCFCYWILVLTCSGFDFMQLVATITHQSHLCPLPLAVQPIIWNYDHCLHLYPTPHTVLLVSCYFPVLLCTFWNTLFLYHQIMSEGPKI